ncbi:MAG: arginine--tRNA ligase [Candidatus Aenigmatarchaeota archaeon]
MFEKFRKDCEKICGKYSPLLEKPRSGIADLALPCFSLAKEQKRAPNEIAQELADRLKPRGFVGEIRAESGYVNFYADWKKLSGLVIKKILAGVVIKRNKERIMVEYSAPNSNKPLHIGHLRNDSIGMSVANILCFAGFKVVKANLVNDRGIHICKSMLAYKKWGKNKKPSKKTDHFVGDYYVMFEKNKTPELETETNEMLRKWEENDKPTIALWKKMNNWAISGFRETYKNFGSEFDVWFFESDFYDKAKDIINSGMKKGIFFKDDSGNIVAKLEPYDMPNRVVLRADGTTVYITNDMALTRHKFKKFKIAKSIWVVGNEQNLSFKQLFKIFELLGYRWNCHHLSYGMVNLPSGRMKSREGTVVDADDLIAEMTMLASKETKKRHKKISKVDLKNRSRQIALAAIKYYMLKVEPGRDILFDPEKAISFEGDTGPYIQYTYARAMSILKKSKKKMKIGMIGEEEHSLAKKLSVFPEVVSSAARDLKPHYIANYIFSLASMFNEYYHKTQVIGSSEEQERLALVKAVAITLKTGLELLGIDAIEKM